MNNQLSISTITISCASLMTFFMCYMILEQCEKNATEYTFQQYNIIPFGSSSAFPEQHIICNFDTLGFPMISDLLAIYDGMSCVLFTVFSLCCMLQNVRVSYDIFNDKYMFISGIIATFSFFPIAYFDEHESSAAHSLFATLFFISCTLYIIGICQQFDNIYAIYFINFIYSLLIIFGIAVIINKLFKYDYIRAPIYEWLLALSYINFFVFVSLKHNYYDVIIEGTAQECNKLCDSDSNSDTEIHSNPDSI